MAAPDEYRRFIERYPRIHDVDLLIPDTNGLLRGKRVAVSALEKVFTQGINLPGSLFGADITGDTVEETGLGFSIGDADQLCLPVPGSLVPIPWSRGERGELLLAMYTLDREPFFADPRHVLARILERLRTDFGLNPVVALELEFYLIDRARAPGAPPVPPTSPTTGLHESTTQVYGMQELDDYATFLNDVAATCEAQDIPADTAVAEYAPAQYEINLHHVDDAMQACDHALRLKRVIKQMARQNGWLASFMAKPYPDMAGSGTHIHVSLVDEQGRNVFDDGSEEGSPRLHQAIAGLLATMAEGLALFAPNPNAMRRFQPESFVPLAPNWGYNNRTTALRVPAGPPEARRVEHRVAGADVNPYLLTAAVLAGIHYGLSQGLTPPPAAEGNAYLDQAHAFATTCEPALEALERGSILPDYLGRDFLHVYLANKRGELARFQRQITPLEYNWYLLNV